MCRWRGADPKWHQGSKVQEEHPRNPLTEGDGVSPEVKDPAGVLPHPPISTFQFQLLPVAVERGRCSRCVCLVVWPEVPAGVTHENEHK